MRRKTASNCSAALLLSGLALAACGAPQGKATDLLTITPNASVSGDSSQFQPPLTDCNPAPEATDSTASDLRFDGPCSFVETQGVQCVNRTDDFYAYISRRLPDYAQLSALVNVEKYHGPGTYTKNSVVFVQVARHGVLYEWRQDSATLTVSDGGNKVLVTGTSLPPLSGNPARGVEKVAGTLACAS